MKSSTWNPKQPLKYGDAAAVLKPLDEVMLPDPRWSHQAIGSANNWRKFDVSDLHARLCLSQLGAHVPEDVRRQWDMARNLMLYSWHVFEFSVIAEQHAYGALEFALRTAFPNAKRTIRKRGNEIVVPETLSPLLRRAREAGLIVPAKLPAWQRVIERRKWQEELMQAAGEPLPPTTMMPEKWFDHVIEIIPDFRNSLAHGGFKLYFEASFNTLELCYDLINALFPPPPPADPN